jgi:hypothetical protein
MLAAPQPAGAHRLDEYLQATRLGLSRDRIQIDIDLTPGVDVASSVRQTIDLNHDGAISSIEERVYASAVVDQLVLLVDGHLMRPSLEQHRFPTIGQLSDGTGTIQLAASVTSSALPGAHRLSFRNSHRPDIGAYLVNALAPESDAIVIGAQRRDPLQRGLELEFAVEGSSLVISRPAALLSATSALTLLAIIVRRRAVRAGSS